MATNNSTDTSNPITVAQGGTGDATVTGVLTGNGTGVITGNAVTQFAPVVGGASNAVGSISVGSAGQVLQSGGNAANPVYSTATYPATAGSTGKIHISDGTNIIASTPTYPNSASGTGTILRADGTNWVATTATYPTTTTINQILFSSANNVVGEITTGNNGALITSAGGVPSISSTLPTAVQGNITSTGNLGNQLNTTRCAFYGNLGSTVSNVTGDSSLFNLGTTTALTSVFDQGSNLNTNGTFTAPVTGKYFLCGAFLLTGGTNISTRQARFTATGQTFFAFESSSTGTQYGANFQIILAMTAGDTCLFGCLTADTGGKVDDLIGAASSSPNTFFQGFLIC